MKQYEIGDPAGRTPWFSPDQKPARPGVYEVEWRHRNLPQIDSYFNYFNGTAWQNGNERLPVPTGSSNPVSENWTLLRWRGLAEQPQ